MPIEPDVLLRTLRKRHLSGLTRRQLQVLALCSLGYTVADMSAFLSIAVPTVRRHLAELEARIFAPTELWPTHQLLARWTREHEDCCSRPMVQMIQDHQLFDRIDQQRRHA